ncbi:MAG TPA: hypothetical protein PLT25_10160, partial [Acidocella sp.]|nr:hypothetical protein [Acidocella sp.]
HQENSDTAHMARALHSAAAGCRFVVRADETDGLLDTYSLEKLSHKSGFLASGLPQYLASQVQWYIADDPAYRLRRAFSNTAAYAMVAFDVAIKIDLN